MFRSSVMVGPTAICYICQVLFFLSSFGGSSSNFINFYIYQEYSGNIMSTSGTNVKSL